MQLLGTRLERSVMWAVVAILGILLALSASDAFGETGVVLDALIATGSDDAFHASAGWPGYSDGSGRIFAGTPSSSPVVGGWRWTGIGLPNTAVITAAYVELIQKGWGNGLTTTLSFEDAASPATFTPASSPADRWASRTAFDIPWSWGPQTPGTLIQTPSLVAGIQQLVDAHGAVNEIVLLEDGSGVPSATYHEWSSFERSGSSSARLHIEYLAEPDVTPPIISAVAASASVDSAIVTWSTNEFADSVVNFGTDATLGTVVSEPALVKIHSVSLTGLAPETTYLFDASSTDAASNTSTDNNGGLHFSFTTEAVPPPPAISNVLVTGVSDTTATVTWTTDLVADSVANYGVSTALGSIASDGAMVTSHVIALAGLNPSTQYFLDVESTSPGGTTTDNNSGAHYSFTTLEPQGIVISDVQVTDITSTSANLSWTTNITATSRVERSPTESMLFNCAPVTTNPPSDDNYCSVWDNLNPDETTDHFFALTTLKPNTTYFYRVISTNHQTTGEVASDAGTPNFFTTLPAAGGTLVDTQVGAGSDDAYHAPDGWPGFNSGSGRVFAGEPSGRTTWGGWRWTGLGLPAGAVVKEAWVELTQRDWNTGITSTLSLENSDTPATFTGGSTPFDRWAGRTAFEVRWPWAHIGPGSVIRTPSLVAGIQELVDAHGAVDEIVLLEDGSFSYGGRYHEWKSIEGGGPAQLHIEYLAEADVTPPIISAVAASASVDSAIVTWSTNEFADSVVNFGTDATLGTVVSEPALVKTHSVSLTGLAPETTYFFDASSTDAGSNTSTDNNGGLHFSFTTEAVPPPPAISKVLVTGVSDKTATVTWTTNLVADSVVNYGVSSTTLGSIASDGAAVTSHVIALADLTPSTQYFLDVESTSPGGTTTDNNSGSHYSFTTLEPQGIVISDVQVTDITATSASLRWTTNVVATSRAERSPTESMLFNCAPVTTNPPSDDNYCSVWDNLTPHASAEHFFALTTLKPNTTYFYRVISTNQTTGEEASDAGTPNFFTTLPAAGGTLVDAQIGSGSDDAYDVPSGWPGFKSGGPRIYAGEPAGRTAWGGWRWTGLGLPAGAVIKEAWVELNQRGWGNGITTTLSLEDSASPATFSGASTPFDRWAGRTAFEVKWPWGHLTPGEWIRTPSLVGGIQELVDAHGAIGEIVLIEDGSLASSSRYHEWASYNVSSANAAKLHVEYVLP